MTVLRMLERGKVRLAAGHVYVKPRLLDNSFIPSLRLKCALLLAETVLGLRLLIGEGSNGGGMSLCLIKDSDGTLEISCNRRCDLQRCEGYIATIEAMNELDTFEWEGIKVPSISNQRYRLVKHCALQHTKSFGAS